MGREIDNVERSLERHGTIDKHVVTCNEFNWIKHTNCAQMSHVKVYTQEYCDLDKI